MFITISVIYLHPRLWYVKIVKIIVFILQFQPEKPKFEGLMQKGATDGVIKSAKGIAKVGGQFLRRKRVFNISLLSLCICCVAA